MKTSHVLQSRTGLGAVIAASLFASFAPLAAASEVGAFVNLIKVAAAYETRGWYLHDFAVQTIDERDYHDLTVHLDRGDRMIVRGEGDDSVIDLDLGVFTPGGRLVKKDIDYDRTPCVEFTATVTGTYRIRVLMTRCLGYRAHCAVLLAEKF